MTANRGSLLLRAFYPLALVLAGIATWSFWPSEGGSELPQGWAQFADSLAVQDILCNAPDVIVAGIGGMVRIDSNGNEWPMSPRAVGPEPMIRDILIDSKGRLWIGHHGGLVVHDENHWVDLAMSEGAPLRTVRALVEDGGGRIWAGGDAGLFQILPRSFEIRPIPLPAEGSRVAALLLDAKGDLWVGTEKNGVGRLHDGQWQHWTVEDGLPHPQVTALLEDAVGTIWSGHGFYNAGGAVRYRLNETNDIVPESIPVGELAGPKVRSLFDDGAGNLWLGHEYDGVTVRHEDKTVRLIGLDDGLPDPEVTVFCKDWSNNLWLGTMKGAVRLSPSAVNRLLVTKEDARHDA
jgi:ligand-binding sensor domain-containing protein